MGHAPAGVRPGQPAGSGDRRDHRPDSLRIRQLGAGIDRPRRLSRLVVDGDRHAVVAGRPPDRHALGPVQFRDPVDAGLGGGAHPVHRRRARHQARQWIRRGPGPGAGQGGADHRCDLYDRAAGPAPGPAPGRADPQPGDVHGGGAADRHRHRRDHRLCRPVHGARGLSCRSAAGRNGIQSRDRGRPRALQGPDAGPVLHVRGHGHPCSACSW